MEDYIQNIRFKVEQLPNRDLVNTCTSLLRKEDGIQKVKFENQIFTIDFNPYMISGEEIIHEIEETGINPAISEQKQKGFKKWLMNLAAQNKKNLGGQRLDCCDMNH